MNLEEKRWLTILDFDTPPKHIEFIVPYVEYIEYSPNVNSLKNKTKTNKMDIDSKDIKYRTINFFIRNLPVGSVASEESIIMARKLGIELPAGKTFVKEFRKKVYVNKNN